MNPCINNVTLFGSNLYAVLMLVWGQDEWINCSGCWIQDLRLKKKDSWEKKIDIKEDSFLKCAWFTACILMCVLDLLCAHLYVCVWCLPTNQLDKDMLIGTTQTQRKAYSQLNRMNQVKVDTMSTSNEDILCLHRSIEKASYCLEALHSNHILDSSGPEWRYGSSS